MSDSFNQGEGSGGAGAGLRSRASMSSVVRAALPVDDLAVTACGLHPSSASLPTLPSAANERLEACIHPTTEQPKGVHA